MDKELIDYLKEQNIINGFHTVRAKYDHEDTVISYSFFDWIMMKLFLSDNKKVKKRFRKKSVQTTEEE